MFLTAYYKNFIVVRVIGQLFLDFKNTNICLNVIKIYGNRE